MTHPLDEELPCQDTSRYSPDDWFASEDATTVFEKERPSNYALEVRARCLQECPIYHQCREYALREGIPQGIFGGMGGAHRRHIWKTDKRNYPNGRPKNFDQLMDRLLPNTNTIAQQARRAAEALEREQEAS